MRTTELLRRSARYLEAHGVESPERNAELLLQHVLGTDRAGLYARRDGLNTAEARAFGRALCQRCTGTPIQHLTGEAQFLDLVLEVWPGVFVPRPETEGVVEAALEVLSGVEAPVVVDVGTGTGAVALGIKYRRTEARVIATDLSDEAVALARSNANRLGLDVEVMPGDMLGPLPSSLRGVVDLIVSNPPYVTEEEWETLPDEVKADPRDALVGGVEVHRRLVEAAADWLRPGGWLVVEIGATQGEEIRRLFEARMESVEVLSDLADRDRVVRGRLGR